MEEKKNRFILELNRKEFLLLRFLLKNYQSTYLFSSFNKITKFVLNDMNDITILSDKIESLLNENHQEAKLKSDGLHYPIDRIEGDTVYLRMVIDGKERILPAKRSAVEIINIKED